MVARLICRERATPSLSWRTRENARCPVRRVPSCRPQCRPDLFWTKLPRHRTHARACKPYHVDLPLDLGRLLLLHLLLRQQSLGSEKLERGGVHRLSRRPSQYGQAEGRDGAVTGNLRQRCRPHPPRRCLESLCGVVCLVHLLLPGAGAGLSPYGGVLLRLHLLLPQASAVVECSSQRIDCCSCLSMARRRRSRRRWAALSCPPAIISSTGDTNTKGTLGRKKAVWWWWWWCGVVLWCVVCGVGVGKASTY